MKKILVANRGEIALRIMRSMKEMGISTVAVYSTADREAPFVRFADEAVCIGPPASAESYLQAEKIIDAALKTGAEGIHPGYGFLSENATFAQKTEAAGLIFIGPTPAAIEMMGNKLAAKQAAQEYDVPLVPGTAHPIENKEEAIRIASEIGFPVLIKAAAGGGGKGMRVVHNAEEFPEQMDRAISEAKASFGDGSVFLERYVESPRHIEIQILSDKHGNHLYLFERECSIQRRHQKVVEEAPASRMTPELRRKMGESAVRIAQACQYVGAGTVEFLVDQQGNYYFLEMNTRLQVEHPVTEMITGKDLVKEQVKIARGEKLSFGQEDLSINGHAIELRIYAEDSYNNFLPDTGKLERYRIPSGPGVRVDSGYDEGMDIPVYYDPMIAKMTVHAETREAAIDRMHRAIRDYQIIGVSNTLQFGRFVMENEHFRTGNYGTDFVPKYYSPEKLNQYDVNEAIAAAISTALIQMENKPANQHKSDEPVKVVSRWKEHRRQH
jgi:acetyl-CoA carboxylase biotin carboxylase subunit